MSRFYFNNNCKIIVFSFSFFRRILISRWKDSVVSRPRLISATIVYIRSFDVDSRPGQRAVVVVVADVATVVVHISTRPRKYWMRYELELELSLICRRFEIRSRCYILFVDIMRCKQTNAVSLVAIWHTCCGSHSSRENIVIQNGAPTPCRDWS